MQFIVDIIDFNTQILKVLPLPAPKCLEPNVSKISIESLVEEMNELKEGHDEKDIIKCIDSIADALYFGIGVLYKIGLDANQIFHAVSTVHPKSSLDVFEHFNNMYYGRETPKIELLSDDLMTALQIDFDQLMAEFSNVLEDKFVYSEILTVSQMCQGFINLFFEFGLTPPIIKDVMAAVHMANMEKKLGVNAKRGDGKTADAVKPEGWIPPEERIGEIIDFYTK